MKSLFDPRQAYLHVAVMSVGIIFHGLMFAVLAEIVLGLWFLTFGMQCITGNWESADDATGSRPPVMPGAAVFGPRRQPRVRRPSRNRGRRGRRCPECPS